MSIRLLWMAIMSAAQAVINWLELDYMEYSTDANAQEAYVTNGLVDVDRSASWENGIEDRPYATLTSSIGNITSAIVTGDFGGECRNVFTSALITGGKYRLVYNATGTVGTSVLYISSTSISIHHDFGAISSGEHTIEFTAVANDEQLLVYTVQGTTCNFSCTFSLKLIALQSYSESTIKTQGSYALKAVAAQTDSLNKTLTKTFASPINLSNKTQIKYDVRASRTGSNFKLGFHDSGGTTTESTPTISTGEEFQTVTVDISAVADADKDAIDSLIITVVNADEANTLYIDNIRYS